MDKNGNKSCRENYRHVDIHYLFVKDRVDIKNISIAYCSTEHMLVYFFTKALQGVLFVKFREVIKGCKNIYTLQMEPPSTNEYVGNVDDVYPIK